MDWSQQVLKVLSTGIIFIMLAAICILLIVRIQRVLAIENKREHMFKLSNQANFTSVFNLSVVSVEKIFSFQILLNNIPLIVVPQQAEVSQPLLAASSTTAAGQPAQNKTGDAHTANRQIGTNNMKEGAVKSGKAVAAKAGLLASIMSTIASLLPGSLGSNLRAQSETLRQAQSNTQAAIQAPEDAKRKMEVLQQQSGKLAGTKPTATISAPPKTQQPTARSDASSANSQAGYPHPKATKKAVPGFYMVQTQPVDPGDSLSLMLRIETPKQRRLVGTFAYTLSSQQLPLEALGGAEQSPVTKPGVLHFPHIDVWRYWLAPISSLLVIAVFLFTATLIYRIIWYL